ncbi:hypothetical protein G3I15_21290, partial [Streptomyces sp. SID10244]|nr:hypothetical protein [Streptomyces sp. SID10244]
MTFSPLPSVNETAILAQGSGPVVGDDYLPCRPEEIFWGDLPCATDRPVMSVMPGTTLTIDTL